MPTAIIMHFIECMVGLCILLNWNLEETANRDLLTAESGALESCGAGV